MKSSRLRRKPKRRINIPQITIDLNNRVHRRNLLLVLFAISLVGTAFLYGNYKVYEYTESSEFCGTACHTMEGQFVRYEHSSHAQVECVECHIGPGMDYFIRSKIDGLRQVYAVLTETYSKPIKSPVHNLRPARETCENCHSPKTFKDNIIKTIKHYDDDEENTLVQSTLILKMGGWQEASGIGLGIHWHITNNVYYIAADDQRQVILWVGVEQPDGSLKEYFARDALSMAQTSFVEEAFEAEEGVRLMDCIDCHNRAAHYIPYPEEAVDTAISEGWISQDIPFIRAKAVEVLSTKYTSETEAFATIESLQDYYNSLPGLSFSATDTNSELDVIETLSVIKDIYSETNFPEMHLDWQSSPNNSRHTPTLGCFRCHDGNHVSVDERGSEIEVISVQCNLCHTVPIVGRGDELLVDAPVIVGSVPDSHSDFSWTVKHRSISPEEQSECLDCHGGGFCNNGACHNLSHPVDMLYTHPQEYQQQGGQVCYTCHQNIHCSRCHPGGIVDNP